MVAFNGKGVERDLISRSKFGGVAKDGLLQPLVIHKPDLEVTASNSDERRKIPVF